MPKEANGIITDHDPFSPSYMPEKLLHRDGEYTQMAGNLRNFTSSILVGGFGSGKTTLTKSAMKEFNASGLGRAAYIDCDIFQTPYSILKEVLPRSELVFYRSNYELIRELRKYVKENRFAIILDNFEQLKDKDLIARFISLGVCVVLLTDKEESLFELDTKIRSVIPTTIRTEAYTPEQSYEILKSRAEKTLTMWSYSDELLRTLAGKINGNITLGLSSLRAAALKAEAEGRPTIAETDICVGENCPNQEKLSRDEKVLLDIVREHDSLPAGRLYSFYSERSSHPKCERAVRNYMQSLQAKGLVKAVGEKRGRVYESGGEEDVQSNN